MAVGSGLLGKLFGRSTAPRESFAPPGQVLYVIGDVHGRADLLFILMRKIAMDAARNEPELPRELIFLGDYVDRGPDSRRTIDLVLSAQAERRFWSITALKGDHDEAMLRFLRDPAYWTTWERYGARETLLAYGVPPPLDADGRAGWFLARDQLQAAIPPDHLDFLRGLQLTARRGDYFCVHAGARPGVPLEHQSEEDLLAIREGFLGGDHVFDKVIVHGHTPGDPFLGPHRIALDTGAYVTNTLTAVKLKDARRTLFQVHGEDDGPAASNNYIEPDRSADGETDPAAEYDHEQPEGE
jgi:serine/threonine protein phosphatase 1